MWSHGVYDLRLTPERFWRLNPAQFALLSKRWSWDNYRQDMRAAMAPVMTYNVNRGKRRKALTVETLIGKPPEQPRRKRRSGEELLSRALQINQMLGGVDKRLPRE